MDKVLVVCAIGAVVCLCFAVFFNYMGTRPISDNKKNIRRTD